MQPLRKPEPSPRPEVVPPPVGPRPGGPRKTLIVLALIAAAGVGVYTFRAQLMQPFTGGGGGGPVVVKTAPATRGNIERTIRLSGATVAEKYVSLVAPQLRGGRGGGGVTMTGGGGRGGGMVVMISSGGGGGGGGSSSGGSSGGSGGSGGSSTGSATSAVASALSGGSTGSSSAGSTAGGSASSASRTSSGGFRSSGASRFGSSSMASAASSSSSRSSGGASSAGGSGGGFSGGDFSGMSGGVSDFLQVLQKASEPGRMVRKGDVVAEFDRQYQETRLDDFRSNVEQGETNMKSLDAELEVTRKAREFNIQQARSAVEKAKLDIRTTPVLSQIQAERLKLQLEEAEAQLKQLLSQVPFQQVSERAQRRNSELSLESTRKELQMAQRNVERMSLTAPMDGMVVMQQTFRSGEFSQIKVGDQLMPGQMFMQIVDPSSMMVAASVNQADVELIRVGAQARLHFDAYPGLEVPGRVVSIGAMTKTGGQRADFVKEIPVFIKVERIDPRIIPDLSVSADVVIAEEREQILIPLESVRRDEPGQPAYVFVRTAAGYEKRNVELGLTSNVKASVRSGLKEGETVLMDRPPQKPASQKGPVARAPWMKLQGVDYV